MKAAPLIILSLQVCLIVGAPIAVTTVDFQLRNFGAGAATDTSQVLPENENPEDQTAQKNLAKILIKRQANDGDTIAEVAELIPATDGQNAPSLEITYRITKSSKNTPKDVVAKTLRKAFDQWEEKADVAFVPTDNGQVDLDIRFEDGAHGDKEAFDGNGGIAAHAIKSKRASGDSNAIEQLHFDDGDDWTEDSLFKIASSQIGKVLQMSNQQESQDTQLQPYQYQNPYPFPQEQEPFYNSYQYPYYPYPSPGYGGNYYGGGGGYYNIYPYLYQQQPYYGNPPYAGTGIGIEIDTFYWSNYDSSSAWNLNQNDILVVQKMYGSPNQQWLRTRNYYRQKYGHQYSSRHHNRISGHHKHHAQGQHSTNHNKGIQTQHHRITHGNSHRNPIQQQHQNQFLHHQQPASTGHHGFGSRTPFRYGGERFQHGGGGPGFSHRSGFGHHVGSGHRGHHGGHRG